MNQAGSEKGKSGHLHPVDHTLTQTFTLNCHFSLQSVHTFISIAPPIAIQAVFYHLSIKTHKILHISILQHLRVSYYRALFPQNY